jgi:hypothetical protein
LITKRCTTIEWSWVLFEWMGWDWDVPTVDGRALWRTRYERYMQERPNVQVAGNRTGSGGDEGGKEEKEERRMTTTTVMTTKKARPLHI